MPLPDFSSIADAVVFNNTKMFGDAGANLPLQNSQQLNAHGARINFLSESVQAMWANVLATPDPSEAISTQKMLTGTDAQQQAVAMALIQALAKMAGNVPPVTP
jgi:hypothetical protein